MNDMVRKAFPAIFGTSMDLTLRAAAEDPASKLKEMELTSSFRWDRISCVNPDNTEFQQLI